MVVTRQSTANGMATNGTSKSRSSTPTSDTIHVLQPSSSKAQNAPTTPKPPSAALSPMHLCSISDHDLSLTSPSSCDTPEDIMMSTPKRKHDEASHLDSASASALRQLTPERVNTAGGALNPIIVTDSPPPGRAPNRKRQRQSAPHKFLDRGYRKLYSYRPSGPALAPQPAVGSTFTGHRSHDIYRMMNAKMAAESRWSAKETSNYRSPEKHGLPFEVRDPMSVQYPVLPRTAMNQPKTPHIQYYDHYAPQLNVYPPVPAQDEETLRKKAVQYVREYSRPTLRKKRLSDADPDETSNSESEQPTKTTQSSLVNSTPHPSLRSQSSPFISTARPHNGKPTISHDYDPNIAITQLTEHTSLLSSLLQIYPHSTDQKGLREDIAMLVSVQNQRVAEWMNAESQKARKQRRRRSNTDSAISVSSQCEDGSEESAMMLEGKEVQQRRLEQEKRRGQDDEMRRVLSATANMWQDGSGLGVADVFGQATASSPTLSLLESSDGRMMGVGGEVVDLTLTGESASCNGDAELQ